jgi:hypothetical protein
MNPENASIAAATFRFTSVHFSESVGHHFLSACGMQAKSAITYKINIFGKNCSIFAETPLL